MRHLIFAVISILFIETSRAALLDKISAVVNSNVITLSEINRTHKSVGIRKNISPQIYIEDNYSSDQIQKLVIRKYLVRAKLSEMGYDVTDEQVDEQIRQTESRLGLTREKLLDFLKSNHSAFDEYFEIIRESIEFSIFFQRVIIPLVSITDQDVKNTYYKSHSSHNTLAFRYGLVDYSIPKSKVKGNELFADAIARFQKNGQLSNEYSDYQVNEVGDITEDGLSKEVKELLKQTDEGAVSRAVVIGDHVHVFYVKRKDLVESESFIRQKEAIKDRLFEKQAKEMITIWHEREEQKHYLKIFK